MDDHSYGQLSEREESRQPPSNRDTGAPVDEMALAQLRALDRPGRPSVFARILIQYLATAAEGVDKIREAIRAGDAATLNRVAHRLKSSSAQVGALSMANSCRELEAIGRSARVDGASQVFERLMKQHGAVAQALQIEIAKREGVQR